MIVIAKAKYLVVLLPLVIFFEMQNKSFSQCFPMPDITLTPITDKITLDDFSEITGGMTINAVYVNVNADPTGLATCAWDLYVDDATIASSLYTASPSQGGPLTLANIGVRVRNSCETSEQDYGGGSPPCTPDPTRICYDFATPLVAGGDNYIIGSNPPLATDDGILLQNAGPCAGVENINDLGTASGNPNTHRFRIDLQIIPGVLPVITPGFYTLELTFAIIDDDRVGGANSLTYSLQIDVQPILQLKMNTSKQLDFVFDDIKKYNAGIVQYAATILNVSSNMNWDLIAVGTSNRNEGGAPFWDGVPYSSGGSVDIPINALELHQKPINPFPGADYSAAFISPPTPLPLGGANNIEVATGISTIVPEPLSLSTGDKTIAGNWDGGLGAGNSMGPGTYTPDMVFPVDWNEDDFKYVIDYKLTPGLPAEFRNGTPAMPNYATSGFYTMQVRYILSEDQ